MTPNGSPQRPAPALNWPNRLTILRILLVGPLIYFELMLNTGWTGWRYLALAALALMAVSDALDGFLARRLNQETPLGRFLDPLADKLLVTSMMILMAVPGTAVPGFELPSWVPVVAIGKDLLTVAGFAMVYLATGEYFIRPRIWGKACTTIQFVMMVIGLAGPDVARVIPAWTHVFAASYILASVFAAVALIDYIIIGNRFAAEKQAASGAHPKN